MIITMTLAPESERDLKSRNGINGAFAKRPSLTRKPASTTTPAMISASVVPFPQPVVSVRTIPNTSKDSPTVASTAPTTSKACVAFGLKLSAIMYAASGGADEPDRDVDEEDPAPVQRVNDHPAEQHARRPAGAADRAPDPDRAMAFGRLGESRGQDRQAGGGDDRAAEALNEAGDDQLGPGIALGRRPWRQARTPLGRRRTRGDGRAGQPRGRRATRSRRR